MKVGASQGFYKNLSLCFHFTDIFLKHFTSYKNLSDNLHLQGLFNRMKLHSLKSTLLKSLGLRHTDESGKHCCLLGFRL